MIFELHLSKLTVDQGLHNLFHLLFFSQILLVGLSFFFSLFIHLSLDHILRLIAFTLLFWLGFLHLSLLPFFLLEHFSLKFCLIDLNKWEMLPANLLCVLAFTRAVWLSLYWGSLAVFFVLEPLFLNSRGPAFITGFLCLLLGFFFAAAISLAGPTGCQSKFHCSHYFFIPGDRRKPKSLCNL